MGSCTSKNLRKNSSQSSKEEEVKIARPMIRFRISYDPRQEMTNEINKAKDLKTPIINLTINKLYNQRRFR